MMCGSHNIDVKYRMAYVGTVALTDRSGEVLAARKYAVPAREGDEERRAAQLVSWRQQLLRDDRTITRIATFSELQYGWLRSHRRRLLAAA